MKYKKLLVIGALGLSGCVRESDGVSNRTPYEMVEVEGFVAFEGGNKYARTIQLTGYQHGPSPRPSFLVFYNTKFNLDEIDKDINPGDVVNVTASSRLNNVFIVEGINYIEKAEDIKKSQK